MGQLNKRQLQAQNTRDAIYAAVNALVLEMPFEKIRIQDICQRAEISLGAFYHYFSSKGDLLVDRYHRTNQHFGALYQEKLSVIHAVDALKLYVEEMARYCNTRLPSILQPYFIASMENAQKWELDEAPVQERIISDILKRGFEKGEIGSAFTQEEIEDFITCQCKGIVAAQCMTQGVFLKKSSALTMALVCIESLRA